jgi:hypothetical protein
VLVDAGARFAGRRPVVAGKPEPALFEETVRRVGGSRPLVVGDRLDTDIEGAVNTGYDSLLVMTGVTGVGELVAAPAGLRPTYLCADLAGLGAPHPAPEQDQEAACLGGWRAEVRAGALRVTGDGSLDDWWRVVATVGWRHLDDTHRPVDVSEAVPPGSVARDRAATRRERRAGEAPA